MVCKKKGQVWIETVLYTVIGLSIIALVLSFAYPKVRAAQENILIEQSIATLNNLDQVITTVNDRGPGNIKTYTFTIKRGKLTVDQWRERITLEIKNMKSEYSEPGVPISEGRVSILTSEGAKAYTITLSLDYTSTRVPSGKLVDISLKDRGAHPDTKEFVQAPTPYVISVSYGSTPGMIVIEEGVITS